MCDYDNKLIKILSLPLCYPVSVICVSCAACFTCVCVLYMGCSLPSSFRRQDLMHRTAGVPGPSPLVREVQRRSPAQCLAAFKDHRLLTSAGLPVITRNTGLASQIRCYKTHLANKKALRSLDTSPDTLHPKPELTFCHQKFRTAS